MWESCNCADIGIEVIMQWLQSEKKKQLKVHAPKFLLLLNGFLYL